jgi:predicted sulfurtransferase
VFQLNGGIHKYVQTMKEKSNYDGKLFVFDRRVALDCGKTEIVGKCCNCADAYDTYDAQWRCASCRVLLLVCERCRAESKEETAANRGQRAEEREGGAAGEECGFRCLHCKATGSTAGKTILGSGEASGGTAMEREGIDIDGDEPM